MANHGHNHGHGHTHKCLLLGGIPPAYVTGQQIGFECLKSNGEWGSAPVCQQTGQPMQLLVGQDGRYSCTWQLDGAQYTYLRELLETERGWKCRISMANDENSYRIPFMLPVWGVVEPAHIHLDNHINMLFHMEDGWIIGATAYPMRERLELASETGQLHVHGSVRWFRSHSYEPLNPSTPTNLFLDSSSGLGRFVMSHPVWAGALTAAATCLLLGIVFAMFFRWYLTPRIVQSIQPQVAAARAAAAGKPSPPPKAADDLD